MITPDMYDANAVAFEVLRGWTFEAGEPVRVAVDVNEPDGEPVTLEIVSATVAEAQVRLVSSEQVGQAVLYHYTIDVLSAVDDWACLNVRATDQPDPADYAGPLGPPDPMSDEGSLLIWVRSNRPPVIIGACGG